MQYVILFHANLNYAYQKHLGVQPRSFWNPECGWRGYV
jgi:predicted glycosyl hydrolase (DUF1957 family)